MGRAPCCDKANVKKGPWSPEEDAKLKSYIEQHGTGGNWIALPQKIGLKRCGKSCRLRWLNYLRPNIKHGGFSEEEDNIICSLYISIGSRWSIIAAQLPGRTDNDIKNYWNTRLKKKLLGSKPRKDQGQSRRSGGGSSLRQQQEANGAANNAYWPDPAMPTCPINQAEHRVSDEHSSIRRLLMKLGGRFAAETAPLVAAAPSQQVYYASANSMIAADPLYIGEGLAGPSGFNQSTELDDLFGCGSAKLEGLDCFYGMGNVGGDIESNNGTSTSSADDTANWSEVSPLNVSYNQQPMMMIDGYQSMTTCLFEEPVPLGTQ